MSALPSFQVRLVISRTLTRVVDAETPEHAEIIARFLYAERGEREFYDAESSLADVQVHPYTPEAGR